jgi:hypothetical protein
MRVPSLSKKEIEKVSPIRQFRLNRTDFWTSLYFRRQCAISFRLWHAMGCLPSDLEFGSISGEANDIGAVDRLPY